MKPTVLVGVSGVPGLFGEEVVRDDGVAGRAAGRLSALEPDELKSEARPADVLAWTDGRALMATGQPVRAGGDRRAARSASARATTSSCFPGVGLGVLVSEAREVTDGMFAAAADALAAQLPDEDRAAGSALPAHRRAAPGHRATWPRR